MKHLLLFFFSFTMCFMALADTTTHRFEAEDATCVKCNVSNDSKYSGGKAMRLTESAASITFNIPVVNKAKYKLFVAGNGVGGDKVVNCTIDGATSTFHLNNYAEVEAGTFFLKEGTNSIIISPNWTWFDVDYLFIQEDVDSIAFHVDRLPIDKDATLPARTLYSFLLRNFGQKCISGIMVGDMSSYTGDVTQHADVMAVYNASGKRPALIGFDFMNATGLNSNQSYQISYTRSSINLAKDTYRRGGIPAFTWHWRDPSRATDAFYSDKSSVKISQALNSDGSWNTNSLLYKQIITDIDIIADFFLELQNEGIACIFRPLHEASGGWFWWGREGADSFIKLFQLVYDEMVLVKGVHNVLWVWNAGTEDYDWNPGESYYDIISADIYNDSFDYSSNYPAFGKLKVLSQGHKIVALSENGPIPDIDKQAEEEAMWSWWMPWYQTWDGGFVDKTSKEEWKKCMNDERVITLEDLAEGWEKESSIESVINENDHELTQFDLYGRKVSSSKKEGYTVVNNKIQLRLPY